MTEIVVLPPRPLAVRDETVLLRAALARNPGAAAARSRLARLLNERDDFTGAIDVLRDATRSPSDAITLCAALFARDAAGDAAQAEAIAAEAAATAPTARARARALAEQAKGLLRRGDDDAAERLLREALACDPGSVAAFKRFTLQQLRLARPDAVLALCTALAAEGVAHPRLRAAQSMALAMAGRADEARRLVDLPGGLSLHDLAPPPGWSTLESFNAAIEAELLGNPAMRFERRGTASDKALRIDDPDTGATPAIHALLREIAAVVGRSAAALPNAPARAVLRPWAVITEGDGREQWHMHPYGSMTGGYYVAVPETVVAGDDEGGCLGFGLPDGLIGKAAADAFGLTLVRPRPGLLAVFPSHAYHRTWVHRGTERRICLAFDLEPS